jgi:hypothetical protein
MAIIPTNSAMDASAAASSRKIFNIATSLPCENIERTLFLFCSPVKRRSNAQFAKPLRLVNSGHGNDRRQQLGALRRQLCRHPNG